MIKSVREHMDCEVVQLTDTITPQIITADSTYRIDPRGQEWIPYINLLLASQSGDVLLLDTDCVVKRDLRPIFQQDFDLVMVCRETKFPKYTDINGVTHYMPWTGGVIPYRNPRFWLDAREEVLKMEDPVIRRWWGISIDAFEFVRKKGYKVILLNADEYNYYPKGPGEDHSGKAVVHYKGSARKHWDLEGNWEPVKERIDGGARIKMMIA